MKRILTTAALVLLALSVSPRVCPGEMLVLEGTTDAEIEIAQRRVFAAPATGLRKLSFRFAVPSVVDNPSLTQRLKQRRVEFTPTPDTATDETDRYGNTFTTVTWTALETDATVSENYTVELGVRLKGEPSKTPYPLPAEAVTDEARRYLAATELVESESPVVRELASRLTRGARTEQAAVMAILNWVVDNIRYRTPIPEYGALWTLSAGVGNCQNLSHLSIALLRASGIPARIVGGISLGRVWKVPMEGGALLQTIGQGGHAWIEVWYPDLGWLPYDAQQSHLFVGPRHIRQTVGLDSTDINDSWRAAPALPPFREDIAADYPRDNIMLTLKESRPGPRSYIMTASIAPPAAPVPEPEAPAAVPAVPPAVVVPPPPPPAPEEKPVPPAAKPQAPVVRRIEFGNTDFPSLMDFYVNIIGGEVGRKTFDKETAEYVTGGTVYAQAFTLEERMTVRTVSLAMHKFGGRIGGLWIDVVADEGGRPGMVGFRSLPLSLDNVSYAPGYGWFDFRFSRLPADNPVLEPGLYWIVLRHTSDAVVSWFYSPGNRYGAPDDSRSTGAGIDFSDILNYDFNFKVTGYSII